MTPRLRSPFATAKPRTKNTKLDAKAMAKLIRVMGVVGESTPTARGAIVPISAENNIADATNWVRAVSYTHLRAHET